MAWRYPARRSARYRSRRLTAVSRIAAAMAVLTAGSVHTREKPWRSRSSSRRSTAGSSVSAAGWASKKGALTEGRFEARR